MISAQNHPLLLNGNKYENYAGTLPAIASNMAAAFNKLSLYSCSGSEDAVIALPVIKLR